MKTYATASDFALLPPEIMGAMKRLEWLSRRRKQGGLSGRHLSPEKGVSVEFAEHREYTPGDDPRNLDWRVMGKSDRNVVRQFTEETNLRMTIALDCSGSMDFRGKEAISMEGTQLSKFEYGRYLAAALAYLLVKQGDAVGLVTFHHEIATFLRAGSRPDQVRQICEKLIATAPGEESSLRIALNEVAQRIPGRGVVVLISDLLDDPDRVVEALHHFDYRHHDLVIFHVLAEEELTFPFQAFQNFEDLERSGEKLNVDPHAIRSEYLERLNSFVDRVETVCGRLRADYVPISTKMSVTDALVRYLGKRAY